MQRRSDKTIARSLGEFFGHIYKGFTTDPAKPRREVSRSTQSETRQTPSGKVTLRRTTIEEVELDPTHLHSNNPDEDRQT